MSNGLEMMLSTEVEILQAENARLNNEVVKLREELALSRDLRRSQAQVNGDLSEQLAKERNKLEMAEAIIAGFDTLITGLKNDLAAAQATIAQMRGYFWRDVVEELPTEAQEVLFVRDNKVVHGAWIGGIFWHSNTKMAASKWMPLPPVELPLLYAAPVVQPDMVMVRKPRFWSKAESDAWHSALPDLHAAFDALAMAAEKE